METYRNRSLIPNEIYANPILANYFGGWHNIAKEQFELSTIDVQVDTLTLLAKFKEVNAYLYFNSTRYLSEDISYAIRYGDLAITYKIDLDCSGVKATITIISGNSIEFIDKETMADIKFHCESDFTDLQIKKYMQTGEI